MRAWEALRGGRTSLGLVMSLLPPLKGITKPRVLPSSSLLLRRITRPRVLLSPSSPPFKEDNEV